MLYHSKSVAKSTNQTRRAGRHSATDPDSFFGEEELENNNNNNNDNNNNESPPQLRALEKYGCKPSCAIFPCTLFSQCCALSPPRLPVGRGNTLSGCGYGEDVRQRRQWPRPPLGRLHTRLQAPVYDILPSTTAVFSYAIGSRKLSANEQFFVVLKQ